MYTPTKQDAVGALKWISQPGDLVLTMGAGDIDEVAVTFLGAVSRAA